MRRAFILLTTALFASVVASSTRAEAPKLDWFEGDLGHVLHVRGMTFVASEGSSNEILLRAEHALFYPDHDVAELTEVEVEVAPGDDRLGFVMRCDRGQLNLSSQDFLAEGNVVGTIEGHRRFEALWVVYDEKRGLLYTDEPVLIVDQDGRYSGGGFRYFVNEQRFRLQGGATVVQEP